MLGDEIKIDMENDGVMHNFATSDSAIKIVTIIKKIAIKIKITITKIIIITIKRNITTITTITIKTAITANIIDGRNLEFYYLSLCKNAMWTL